MNVLVFENDALFVDEIREEFTRLGVTPRIVDDGMAGLQLANASLPDVIVLSVELPKMNGFSICNRIKRDPVLKDIPLVILSSLSNAATFEEHKSLKTRAQAYLHKPVSFGDLLATIRRITPPGVVPANASTTRETTIVIEDEIEADDETTGVVPQVRRPPSTSVAENISTVTDAAFDALMIPRRPMAPVAVARPAADEMKTLREELTRKDHELQGLRQKLADAESKLAKFARAKQAVFIALSCLEEAAGTTTTKKLPVKNFVYFRFEPDFFRPRRGGVGCADGCKRCLDRDEVGGTAR